MRTVMVIEDDDDIREDIREILQHEGYRVAEARDGAEALAWLRSADAPSVILLDLMMPHMDGWEFRAEQRKDPALAQIPTVLLSGAGDLAKHMKELEAAAYLSKPFKLARLLEVVASHAGA